MKILHIFNELKFSGAEIMYVDAAPIFQKLGCTLTAMSTAKELGEYAPYFKKAAFDIIQNEYPPLRHYLGRIFYYIRMVKLFRREKFDVVHIHRSDAMWGMALCAWLVGKKSVYTFHNVFPSRTITYPYHVFLRWSAKKIFQCRFQTISDSVYNHERKYYHNQTTKIYNWYNSERFYPASQEEKKMAKKELKLPERSFVLISVGGCSPIKRHSDIIRALSIVLKSVPNCIYLHLGTGHSEEEEIKLARETEANNSVRFCGNQTDVRNYLIASDIYLMPSKFEGISITTVEAMACHIPAILYDVPGLRDFNKGDVQNCVLIPEDFNMMAEKIIDQYKGPHKAELMADNAQKMVNNIFCMEKNARKIFELYKSTKIK